MGGKTWRRCTHQHKLGLHAMHPPAARPLCTAPHSTMRGRAATSRAGWLAVPPAQHQMPRLSPPHRCHGTCSCPAARARWGRWPLLLPSQRRCPRQAGPLPAPGRRQRQSAATACRGSSATVFVRRREHTTRIMTPSGSGGRRAHLDWPAAAGWDSERRLGCLRVKQRCVQVAAVWCGGSLSAQDIGAADA